MKVFSVDPLHLKSQYWGVRMLRVPNLVKNTIVCASSQKKYTAGCANLQIKKLIYGCMGMPFLYTTGLN